MGLILAVPTSHCAIHLRDVVHVHLRHQRADHDTVPALLDWWPLLNPSLRTAADPNHDALGRRSEMGLDSVPILLRHKWNPLLV